ncbi:hypothetical protein [Subtercola vilae]|uniref:Uncharacterized protein n=1 Tax=Subtercola vilae TaxID=2056433 RepID=A0A4V4RCD1_9MICO|nr:hypothetical protein [Subtercola vilae]TIH26074.1 hypothetical protein D4765_19030 [Subtercola vilae]
MAGKPEGYIDVAERIVEFRTAYPNGSLQQVSLEFVRGFGTKDWVVYTAAAYRTPEDERPGIGTAWEPVPGPTNFTRDSEVQNAETAAWGRAMVATLSVDAKVIASKQEVLARTSEPIPVEIPEATITEWVEVFAGATSTGQLQAAWESSGKAGLNNNTRIVAAKDKRKGELS